MDIRDIKERVLIPKDALGSMFKLQKELLDAYIGIESLPPYPIDLNTKESQILLKDFTGRIIEELGEGYESYEVMLGMFHTGYDRPLMVPHLQNFNEEISDAVHFWLELMVYSGYEQKTMKGWLNKEMGQEHDKDEGLLNWWKFGGYIVDQETQFARFPCFTVLPENEADAFLMGGRKLSGDIDGWIKKYLWDITYHLQIARNTLKNKPWKQTQMLTDINMYEESMKRGAIALFKFMYFVGLEPDHIYEIYYKKNMVNQFRIKSKY